ncbi:MAG: four helix bundle suffix domain-containing protein [bacterium]|nr:four helix bundle suffix domain-containing protein [bacterium]
MSTEPLIPPHGGYRNLKSFQVSQLIYEDFLRQHGLPIWDRDDPRRQELIDRRCTTADDVAQWVREVHQRGQSGRDGQSGQHGPAEHTPSTLSTPSTPSTYPEIAANAALVLLAVACSLLDRQLAAQATAFENGGGFTERLYRVRSEKRTLLSTQSTKPTSSTTSV